MSPSARSRHRRPSLTEALYLVVDGRRELRNRRQQLSGFVRVLLPTRRQIDRREIERITSGLGKLTASLVVRRDSRRLANRESAGAEQEFRVGGALKLV